MFSMLDGKRPTNWREFWDAPNSIFVSRRHRILHDRMVGRDIAKIIPSDDAVVMDYGCGEATAAEHVTHYCRKLILTDAALTVNKVLAERYSQHPKIKVLPANEVKSLAPGSLDCIILNSVVQYLSREEWYELLVIFRILLKQGGAIVIGDIIPPGTIFYDALDLLRFGFESGFGLHALLGLIRTFFSDYRGLRSRVGLSLYDETEMLSLLRAAGYAAERRRRNLGHNQHRMTFVARKLQPNPVPGRRACMAGGES